ncbi:PspC domain-containing protein [Curtobacterium aurantiacum]|uniref:PspC domain-containing protein n=1 Tax=Curtobacterium aurantiacum TaxID=3236919 RepID=A0ABS5VL90_9MICO|nr:PspC domain-containing protein [Curtobacterium flaccumfaciens]MBT1546671.1 PspC domain-containing protein [Curtobacterium flaccumfaciens pv. flaccumfaciens]MBT1589535.1 PspC domain-containing protein [Curtobacterium flaccumfaciens pv. flaccumfaciens]
MTDHQHDSAPGTAAGSADSTTRFFDWVRGLGITRTDDRWLAGVCGAVARRTGLDPLVVRGVTIVVALLGGPVFLAYAVGWALLPDTAGRIHVERMIRGVLDPALIAIGAFVALTFVPATRGIWWQGVPDAWRMPAWLEATLATAWSIVLVGGIVWLIVVLARRGVDGERTANAHPDPAAAPRGDFWTSPEEPRPARAAWTAEATGATDAGRASWQWDVPVSPEDRRRQHEERMRADRERMAEWRAVRAERRPGAAYVAVSLGLALVAGAGVAVWAQQAGWSVPVLGIAAALGVLAVATIVAGVRGRDDGVLGLFSTVAAVALVVTGVLPAGTQVSLIGGTTWQVERAVPGTERNFAMLAGGPTLDLRGLEPTAAGGDVNLWLGAGGAEVLLPTDLPVRVEVSGVGYGVDTGGAEDGEGTGGVLRTTTLENRAARTADADETTTVHLWILGGGVEVPRAITVGE